MKGGESFMNPNVMKGLKIVVSLAGVGVTLASNYFADKDLNDKVAKKVAEAMSKKKES